MAFHKSIDTAPQKVNLIPFMDMTFILILFFLVNLFVAQLSKQEQRLDIPTPKNEPGRAQIMIQLLSDGTFVWVDEQASSIVKYVDENFGYLDSESLRARKMEEVLGRSTYDEEDFIAKLRTLVNAADANPNTKYFVLIRCPDKEPYYRVVDVIKNLTDCKYHNISYGCVGGTLDDIRNCKDIRNVREGGRENLLIEFISD